MADYKKSLYNIALGGQGFLLYGTPLEPARTLVQAPVFGTRFASGDRDYADLTFWWYWAQTEWANGFKDEVSWANDGKFYYSTNINTWSKYGAIKLTLGTGLLKTFGDGGETAIYCGGYGRVGGTTYHFVGTNSDSGGKPIVYRSTNGITFTNISDGQMTSNQNKVHYVRPINNVLWVGTEGSGNTNVILSYSGSAWTDHSAAIIAAMTGSDLSESYSIARVAMDVYIGAEAGVYDRVSLMKYSAGSWSELAAWTDGTSIFDMINYLGDVYYLKGKSEELVELRVWDVESGSDALVQEFRIDDIRFLSTAGKLLHVLNGKLVITIPYKEIWEYNNSALTRIWERDENKHNLPNSAEVVGNIERGGIVHDHKIWWANLMYDGKQFFNTKKDNVNSSIYPLFPLYSNQSYLWWFSGSDPLKLYSDCGYKGTADKNFLVFNQVDTISTIDKLFYSVNLIFKKLAKDQKILIEYSIDEMSSWVSLGNVDYSVDGEIITSKIIHFPENTIYSKIWLKVKLEGDGSNTPELYDISMAYYPLPYYKQRWNLTLNCIDNIVLLSGKAKELKKGEELRNLLKMFWKNRNALEFQDIDYAATAINDGSGLTATATTVTVDSTASFAEQGIIRIENEKIKYSGKTATTFTGCTRHYDGTVAAIHADNVVVSNSYKVILTNYEEITLVGVKPKINEFLVTVELVEI